MFDNEEKAAALNALMEKNQLEGGYKKLRPDMATVLGVGLIKIKPEVMIGKYKLGRLGRKGEAANCIQNDGKGGKNAKRTLELLNIAGLDLLNEESTKRLALAPHD